MIADDRQRQAIRAVQPPGHRRGRRLAALGGMVGAAVAVGGKAPAPAYVAPPPPIRPVLVGAAKCARKGHRPPNKSGSCTRCRSYVGRRP